MRVFKHRKAWRRYREQLRLLGANNLPASKILMLSNYVDAWLHREPWMLVEEFIAGPLLCHLPPDPEWAASLGRSVGKLHAVTAPAYGGRLHRVRPGDFNAVCLRRLDNRAELYHKDMSRMDRAPHDGFDAAVARLRRAFERWRFAGPFVLSHGGLGGDDLIWREQAREVAFIDLHGLRFNHRHGDLAMVHQWMGEIPEQSAMLIAAFDAAYWEAAGPQYREAALADAGIMSGLSDVMRIQTVTNRARNIKERRDDLDETIAPVLQRLIERG